MGLRMVSSESVVTLSTSTPLLPYPLLPRPLLLLLLLAPSLRLPLSIASLHLPLPTTSLPPRLPRTTLHQRLRPFPRTPLTEAMVEALPRIPRLPIRPLLSHRSELSSWRVFVFGIAQTLSLQETSLQG